ncbi:MULTISPECIES: zinc-ribbon and DUF3426 domain-containing protein [unclassified Massilia]|uniref:zinc-ribbon and DUF3426 domain-containing protein n=1 Tax=unclassified Massilia TaxID=2609279 RepID=UPI00177FB88D|nr:MULTISPECIES: zinc-ribbon and DUF3426 domain-containing protein [unclassified Massilia]MBD8530829.1 zinc-ribbon domain-containing protein [Massilia sp. CFBP 13647]MBD8674529.1 zinc-ribbon domain-containing protein [Massilia sp. CFBP 13721]
MALATQCPHCGTMFRVASDQLKLRGGIVRCGSCQEIFDGSATLVDLDALPAKAPAADKAEAPAESAPAPVAESAPAFVPEIAPAPEPEPVVAEAVAEPAPAPELASFSEPAPVAQASVEPPAPTVPEDEPLAPLDVAVALPNFDDQPVYTLDFDHTFDPFGILPKVDTPQEAPIPSDAPVAAAPLPEPAPAALQAEDEPPADAPAPAAPLTSPGVGRIEPTFGLPVDEELVAAPLPDHEPDEFTAPAAARMHTAADAPPMPMREATASTVSHPPAAHIPPVARTPGAKRADKAAARRSKLTPTRIESQPKLRAAEIDEPDFVKRGRQQEQTGRTRKVALLGGAVVMLVLLFAQGAFTFRNALAARFPAAKPALVSGCAVFGCRVELPMQADNLAIETGELTTLGGGAYSFTTELRNTGATAQAWPSLELALTDADDKPLVRRVFAPRDYLAAAATTATANGIAPRAEQPIKLHFRVDDLKPSGYHIAVFYP